MTRVFDCIRDQLSAFRSAKRSIMSGDLVVVPTDTLYGVAADAFQPEAVKKLRALKRRKNVPPVLVGDVNTFKAVAENVPDCALRLAEHFWPGPLTIILRTRLGLPWGQSIAVRIPKHDFLLELLQDTGPLAVSSANISGQTPALTVSEARQMLGDGVRVYLDAGAIDNVDRVPSTIVDLTNFSGVTSKVSDGADKTGRVLRLGAIGLETLSQVARVNLALGSKPC